MTREFVGVSESDSLLGAVELMREEGTDAAVVLRGAEPVGALASVDVLDLVIDGDSPTDTPVSSVMSDPPPVLSSEATLAEAAAEIAGRNARYVLVTDEDGVAGTVEARDLVRATTSLSRPVDRPLAATESGNGERPAPEADRFSTQSICEVCGSLTGALTDFNGQLVCPDCREV